MKTAKSLVLKPEYKSQVVKDKTKFDRREKHFNDFVQENYPELVGEIEYTPEEGQELK